MMFLAKTDTRTWFGQKVQIQSILIRQVTELIFIAVPLSDTGWKDQHFLQQNREAFDRFLGPCQVLQKISIKSINWQTTARIMKSIILVCHVEGLQYILSDEVHDFLLFIQNFQVLVTLHKMAAYFSRDFHYSILLWLSAISNYKHRCKAMSKPKQRWVIKMRKEDDRVIYFAHSWEWQVCGFHLKWHHFHWWKQQNKKRTFRNYCHR